MKPLLFLGLAVTCSFWHLGESRAADVSYFGVVKSAQFQQILGATPTPLASNAYAFTAFVVPATNFAVTNAVFKAPNVSTNRALALAENGGFLQYSEVFQTSAALDAAYPSSASLFSPSVYRFTLETVHDGAQAGNASYLLSGTPPLPQVVNLLELQSVDTTTDCTVRWTAMGGTIGIVQLVVLDGGSNVVYSSPVPFATNALTASSTAATIPANSLPAETNLIGHLTFGQPGLPDNNSYPGAVGVAANAKDTAFPLITRPAPVRPQLQFVAPNLVQFRGETNRHYHLQGASSLALTDWRDLLVTNAATVSFTDTQAVSLWQRYYRVQVGP